MPLPSFCAKVEGNTPLMTLCDLGCRFELRVDPLFVPSSKWLVAARSGAVCRRAARGAERVGWLSGVVFRKHLRTYRRDAMLIAAPVTGQHHSRGAVSPVVLRDDPTACLDL